MAVGAETAKLIASKGPEFPSRELTIGGEGAVKVNSMTDGTTTVIQITLYGEPIGTGISKRRKTDPRNQELGMALALTRAFADAATRYAASVDSLLNPDPDPSAVAVKQLRRVINGDSKRRKDEKRKAAREAHFLKYGWNHTKSDENKGGC